MGGANSSHSVTNQSPVDAAAAGRMATVAEKAEGRSQDMFDLGKEIYEPYERELVKSNMRLVDPNEQLMKARMEEGVYDIQQDRALRDLLREQNKEELTASAPALKDFYKEATGGVNVRQRVNEAGAEVSHQFKDAPGMIRREATRVGADANSPIFTEGLKGIVMDRARAIAGARTTARNKAEADKFNRLSIAMTTRNSGGATRGSLDANPYQQGQEQPGGYRLVDARDRGSANLDQAIKGHAAGMTPMTQGSSESGGWSFLTSSIRFKDDVEVLQIDSRAIQQLTGMQFRYKDTDGLRIGFMAEEMAKILPQCAVHGEDGLVAGICPEHLLTVTIMELQRVGKENEEMKQIIHALGKDVQALKVKE